MFNASEQCIETDQSNNVEIALKAPEYDYMRQILTYQKTSHFHINCSLLPEFFYLFVFDKTTSLLR